MTRPDVAGAVSGMAIALLGFVLLLDQLGEVSLTFGSVAPTVLAVVGVVLVAAGLGRRGGP